MKSIAGKVGAVVEGRAVNSAPNAFSNHTFLSTPVEVDEYNQNGPSSDKQYQMSTFEDIVAGMSGDSSKDD